MASWKENRLQVVLQASREGIWDWDLVKGTIYYSPRMCRFMGYRKSEMPNFFQDRGEHMDLPSVAALDEALRRVLQEGEDLFAVEPRVKTKRLLLMVFPGSGDAGAGWTWEGDANRR
ncbi:PAS domain-containing protein [Akkermansiaceae bacterium]|nr:PAS domain-containing protein [Akkermansiaceae bacterium]